MDLATAAQYRSSLLLSTAAYAPGSRPSPPPQLTSITSSSAPAPAPAMLGGKSLSFSLLVLGEKGRMGAGSNLRNGGHRMVASLYRQRLWRVATLWAFSGNALCFFFLILQVG